MRSQRSAGGRRPRGRRDRRGRGLRGELAPQSVPLHRSRGEAFDDLVLDAVEELEEHWADDVAGIEFAVEDVPPAPLAASADFDPDLVLDHGVPLGRLLRAGTDGVTAPTVVVYRRPVEARATGDDDRGELVFMVVAELVAELLGRDVDDLDPPRR
jgi:predicted Zn-dependent protease with MMP-like domain